MHDAEDGSGIVTRLQPSGQSSKRSKSSKASMAKQVGGELGIASDSTGERLGAE